MWTIVLLPGWLGLVIGWGASLTGHDRVAFLAAAAGLVLVPAWTRHLDRRPRTDRRA